MKNWLFNGKTQLKRKSTTKCHCCRHQISHFSFKGCIENGDAFYYAYCFCSHELASLDVATFSSSITYTVSWWIRCNHNHLLSWVIAFANYMQIKQHFTQNNTAKTTTTTTWVMTKRHRQASRHSWTKSTISTHIHWVESKGHSKKQIESCIRVNSMAVFSRNVFFWQYSVFHKQNYSSYIVIPILFKQFYFQ